MEQDGQSANATCHESLASIWTTLGNIGDPGLCLREATGRHALENNGEDEPVQRSRLLLAYAIELNTIFDIVRTSNSAKYLSNQEQADGYQRHIRKAIAYLINNIQLQYILQRSTTKVTIHTLTRTILSALCALHSLTNSKHSGEGEQIALAAQRLAARIPKDADECKLLQEICSYMITIFGCVLPRSSNRNSIATWSDLYYVNHSVKSDVIEQLIDRATNIDTHHMDKITAMIEICYAYWESDALLIRSCTTTGENQDKQKLSEHSQIVSAAIENRFLIQEHLVHASLQPSNDVWALAIGPPILFPSGLSVGCALNTCHCRFGLQESYAIHDMRRRRMRTSQDELSRFHMGASLTDSTLNHPYSVFRDFQSRWTHIERDRSTPLAADDNTTIALLSQPIHSSQLPIRYAEEYNSTHSKVPTDLEQKQPHQLAICQQYAQRFAFPARSQVSPVKHEYADLNRDDNFANSPPPLSDSGHHSSDQHSRADSITTVMSSKDGGHSRLSTAYVKLDGLNDSEESYKIVVEARKQSAVQSPCHTEESFPEVVIHRIDADNLSLTSESSIPVTVFSTKNTTSKGKWGNLLRGKKDVSGPFNTPKFRFFSSGRHILLWTKYGGAIVDTGQSSRQDIVPIREADITHCVGGSSRFVIISRVAEIYHLSVYSLDSMQKVTGWEVAKSPGAIDLSRSDRYLAIKYTRSLQLYDLQRPGTVINHKLPNHDNSRPGAGNHSVAFAGDSESFMATTRFQPEKVYTYWSLCVQSATAPQVVACSSAPFGNVEDHGLSSLAVCSPTSRSHPNGFLSTFTEKGHPVILHMNPRNPSSRPLRDPKEQIGTRIHSTAASIEPSSGKTNMVMINQDNTVFWVSDLFGRDTETRPISTLKRAKSLKPEVGAAMSKPDEASVFWVDKQIQKGVLVRIGKNGGQAAPVHYRLDVEPLCGG